MKEAKKVLVAGASGYLGRHLTQTLIEKGYDTHVIVRDKRKMNIEAPNLTIFEAEVTQPETLDKLFNGIDVVISAVGITRQKDGVTYMDVDYQANANLIDAAKKNGVKKFMYVSVLNGDKLRHLKICEAKEKLVDYLKSSGLDYCVIRPNGFFSDMGDFLKMAKKGSVYLFRDGTLQLNPIHGKDLATEIIHLIDQDRKELNIGGPDLLTQNEIAELALNAFDKPKKIIHLPDWIRRFTLWSVRTFTRSKTYGPIEFFLTTMVMNMEAPQFGHEKLKDFFQAEARRMKNE
ncbi:MAG: NAD-dependent dehydratase [Bacteroidetes bacterium]|nr:MAG: NAD-dependent dehydratase [Bacteroidota bacterium]